MAQDSSSIPTGRIRRTAKIGGLLGAEAAKSYATKAANRVRSPANRDAANSRRRQETAEHVVDVLGEMKGPAMKIGQMASVIDLGGGLAPGELEAFQAKLGELRDDAPRTSFKDMKKVIEKELGEPLARLFSDFDPQAVAAASIGQVYRARLRDGRDVAVKVQYPGIAAAVRADLQNLGLLLRAAKRLAPGLDVKATAFELRERISEELDYEHEAQAQRWFARRWRGHPFIVVPNVVTELCRTRVLVSEFVDGIGFEELKSEPQPVRDRVGEIVLRFFYGSLYRFAQFSGDPHPGNFLMLPDQRVAFLDFGMTKIVPRERIEHELRVLRAALDDDADGVFAGLVALGFFEPNDPHFDRERVLRHVQALNSWYAQDQLVTLTPEYVSSLLVDAGDPRSDYWDMLKNETLPADSLLASRMQGMTLAAVGELRASGNWHRLMSEWIYGSGPNSPLGVAEAQFFGDRDELASAA
jgi:predicted unusual protein kinase regulating ubiquinone biosynthesis (AarF/ABC1/UbiB family)